MKTKAYKCNGMLAAFTVKDCEQRRQVAKKYAAQARDLAGTAAPKSKDNKD